MQLETEQQPVLKETAHQRQRSPPRMTSVLVAALFPWRPAALRDGETAHMPVSRRSFIRQRGGENKEGRQARLKALASYRDRRSNGSNRLRLKGRGRGGACS